MAPAQPHHPLRSLAARVDHPVEALETGDEMDEARGGTGQGVDAASSILTVDGWRRLDEVVAGTALAHPERQPSVLLDVGDNGLQSMVRVTLADRTSILIDVNQRLPVELGQVGRSRTRHLNGQDLQAAVLRGQLVRLPRYAPYQFGSSAVLPLDPWLLGALLGDGYIREHSVEWCNEQSDMHDMLRVALPSGAVLTPLRVGQAGTASARIVALDGRHNPVLMALRDFGLTGCRAWEKFVPSLYKRAPFADRLAILQGLLDTDGSIDRIGRIEFSSSSERLATDVLDLVQGVGGRATLARKSGITFTSPRQATPKAARDAFRLTNMRLPEDLAPFRRDGKASRLRTGRAARHWKIVDVSCAGLVPAAVVEVSASDGLWVAGGCFPLVGVRSPALVAAA
jgi:hypothetical protein